MRQIDAKANLNWSKTTQNQAKMTRKETFTDLKRVKTSQNVLKGELNLTKTTWNGQKDPKRNNVFPFSRNKLSQIAELET